MKPLQLILICLAALVVWRVLVLTTKAEISESEVRALLKRGALVVDVRTVEEFSSKHLADAVNVPLPDLKTRIGGAVTNKSDVVLLHCRSGRRSGIAERELRALGYTNVFNLGSFERAQKILAGAKP